MADQFTFNGRRVRAWCVDSGITYDELAERIGVPVGTLKAWIYGQRGISFPQANTIEKAASNPEGMYAVAELGTAYAAILEAEAKENAANLGTKLIEEIKGL